jgi:potassium channel subfamily K, other eukaryote
MSYRIVVANAVSLALAVTANLTLLSKFSRGPSFLVAHSVVIVGWYISSFLMITTIAVASTHFQLPSPQDNSPQDNSYSQAFYYACFAAGLYFVVSSLMLVSLLGARSGYYSKESKRVRSDWTLACQTISFKVYLLVGAVVFSRIEEWNYLDAVFWADCTILTIGLGDYAPKTHLGRSLLFPYAIGGVLLLGLVIASIQSFVTQRRERKFSTIMKEKQLNLLKRLQNRYAISFQVCYREIRIDL